MEAIFQQCIPKYIFHTNILNASSGKYVIHNVVFRICLLKNFIRNRGMEVLVIHLTLDSFLNLHKINLNAKMIFNLLTDQGSAGYKFRFFFSSPFFVRGYSECKISNSHPESLPNFLKTTNEVQSGSN